VNFETLVEQILWEMPYIEVGNDIFDLEMEKYAKDKNKFVQKLKNILQGNKHTDKYGNVIHLTTPQQKQEFAKKVNLNLMIKGFLSGSIKNL
jgi:GR25 family glycosyltransferase involved in LPS biosynthesis